jgi:hypothetical protein
VHTNLATFMTKCIGFSTLARTSPHRSQFKGPGTEMLESPTKPK